MTTNRKLLAPLSGARATWFAAVVVAVAALQTPATAAETISMVYEEVVWNSPATRSKLEADFQRLVAASGLKVSPAEVAGAAHWAHDYGSTESEDSWEVQTIIRGCGPAGDLCFVITCNRCRGK